MTRIWANGLVLMIIAYSTVKTLLADRVAQLKNKDERTWLPPWPWHG